MQDTLFVWKTKDFANICYMVNCKHFHDDRHVLMTFELRTLCACLCIFSLYISHLLLSSEQASITMWTILISKSWWLTIIRSWISKTETLTLTLHHNIFTYLDYVFSATFIYIYIYIYTHIYMYTCVCLHMCIHIYEFICLCIYIYV